MVETGILEYTISEINKKKGSPYHMGNEELANELLPYIKTIYPDVQMIKYGISQWFVVSPRAKNKLKKQLAEMLVKRRKSLVELENALERLN